MWNGVFHPDVTRRETGSGNTGAGSTTEGSESIWNNYHRKAEASVVGRRRRLRLRRRLWLLLRCPLSLDEGYHRSDIGLVERLLVAGAEILYLDCAGGHFRFSADGQESDVLAVGVIELLFEF